MLDRTNENLKRINELWELHAHRDSDVEDDGRCLSFTVDRRYLESDDYPGIQFRMGISFGHNPFTPEMKGGFVPPPVLPGKFVFGLHLIANQGRKLTIFDEWYDARESGDCQDGISALERASRILAEIPDEKYLLMVSSQNTDGPLSVSSNADFCDFEIVEGEAF